MELRVYPLSWRLPARWRLNHVEAVPDVLKFVLLAAVILLASTVVQTIVWGLRDRRPWPKKRHLGHWRKWDDDEE